MSHFCSRRTFLGIAAAALAPGHARGEETPIYDASAFIDSIGVNTHLSSEPYASKFGEVKQLLAKIGIRHLRDELRPTNNLNRWRELFSDLGVRSHLLVSPVTNNTAQMMRYITLIGVEKISAIEGQNEGDHEWFQGQRAAQGNWSKAVVEYQKSVYEALRRRYAKDVLPVVSPTVLDWKPQDMALLRDAAGFCDIVAIHSYVQNAQEPETDEPYASLSWYLQEVRDPFKPGAPVMVTETGYNDLQGPGRKGVSEKAAAIYLPRLLLNNFAAGIKRTFLYEFLDEGANPNEWENHWGLVRYDNAPKPSFEAITALIASLKNDGGTPAGDSAPLLSLETSVQDLSNLRMMAFRRPDGSLVTAIWRALPCWTLEEHADVDVSTIPVKLTFEKPIARASLVTLDKPVERRELKAEGAELVLPVGASVALMTTA